MRPARRSAFAAALCALFAAPAAADPPAVVTDIPVVHSLVAQVMGDRGAPVLLLDRGADPHAFQMRPSQARALAAADLVVWIGPEMTPWLARALEGTGSRGRLLTLIEVPGTRLRSYGAEGAGHEHDHGHGHDHGRDHGHDHGQDHGHDHGHEHDHGQAHGHKDGHDHGHNHAHEDDHGHGHGHGDDHDHGHGHGHAHDHVHSGTDPHAWLDPANAAVWVGAIAKALAGVDPEGAAVYTANADAATAALDALDAELRAALAPAAGRPLVVFHDAYGYFAEAYGLTIAGSVAAGDAAAPGAGGMSALRARIEAGEIACAFAEANHAPDLVATLVAGTATPTGVLDPEGTMLDPGPGLYAETLRGLARGIAACLAGAG